VAGREFRSGIVAVVGRPNVGKSTLVNALVGQKVAIVSDRPQTTRRDIRAILTTDRVQVVFTDTPGFHKPRTALGKRLNGRVGDAVEGVDVVIQVVDGASGVGRGDAFVYERQVAAAAGARFCVVNKVDAIAGRGEVPQLAAAGGLGDFDEIVPVSATRGTGVQTLLDLIVARLPAGPPLYPEEMVTDMPMEVRLAELVREQALRIARDEVPHSVAVLVDEFEPGPSLSTIRASIIVERDSQKGIVIGKGGATLKAIGSGARLEMEELLGTQVLKVVKEWQRDPRELDRLGF
jgi:GTPase